VCQFVSNANTTSIDFNNCRPTIANFTDDELFGAVISTSLQGGVQRGPGLAVAGTISGTIFWENIDFDAQGKLTPIASYIEQIGGEDISEADRRKIESEIATLQRNIDLAIEAIESDPRVQFCISGRQVQGIQNVDRQGRARANNQSEARFPNITKQMRLIIAARALQVARQNYFEKFDTLDKQKQEDLVTVSERFAETMGEDRKNARREAARHACVSMARGAVLPRSPAPPKNSFGKIAGGLIIAAAVVAVPFTGGTSMLAVAATKLGTTGGVLLGGLGAASIAGSLGRSDGGSTSSSIDANAPGGPLTASANMEQWNFKQNVQVSFNWENLICTRCTTSQRCSRTKNPMFGSKYCQRWNDPSETCNDRQF